MKWKIVPHEGTDRATLIFSCFDSEELTEHPCAVSLKKGEHVKDSHLWGWNGSVDCASIQPSIKCMACKRHFVIDGHRLYEIPE